MKVVSSKKEVPITYSHYLGAFPTIDPDMVISTGVPAEAAGISLEGRYYSNTWLEPAYLPDGQKCLKVYRFKDSEIYGQAIAEYPWDKDHVEIIFPIGEIQPLGEIGSDDYGKSCIYWPERHKQRSA